jgi:hypothetical protein
MLDKINNNRISDILKEAFPKQAAPVTVDTNDQADASLQISYGSLIDEAKQSQQQEIITVEQARKLIASGELDTPENIRAAAEAITKLGA